MKKLSVGLLAGVLTSSAAWANSANPDPWEGFNRSMFAVNERLDRYVAKPVAKGYQTVMPQVADDAVSRVFNNVFSPITLLNQLLQGKLHAAGETTSRFMFNSTLGVAGIFDVATPMGLSRQQEDFGQTMAVWGVGSGPYVMLPVFGPSTVRDTFGRFGDAPADVRAYMATVPAYGVTALSLVDKRADLLSAERLIEGDRYRFIRDYYLQQRAFDIADGVVSDDPFLDSYDE